MALLTDLFVSGLSVLPKSLVRSLSSQYIAGETIEAALGRLAMFNAEGFSGILDILGEDPGGGDPVEGEAHARAALAQYKDAATRLAAAGGQAYMSAKPTHFGLHVSEDLCFEIYSELASHCAELSLFLRVEMEDHPTTETTLRVFERLLVVHEAVGIVLQSRLFRTPDDIERLIASTPSGRRLDVRMVKGIYLEPAEIAHEGYAPIADAFVACTELLWRAGAHVALGTHDDRMQPQLEALRAKLEVSDDDYEYEVLMGVRTRLWRRWQAEGLPVRVYIPYGPDWHAYSMRRLKKNPKLLRQMTIGMLRR
jgi:proline dehydrogenase